MNYIFSIIFFISLIALIIGMVKPNFVVRWGNNEHKTRKSVFKTYGIILIASFVLFGLTNNTTNNSSLPASNVEKTKVDKEKVKEEKNDKKKAEKVSNLISKLPSIEELTLKNSNKISEAKTAYNDLSDNQKILVGNAEVLNILEKRINDLQAERVKKENTAENKQDTVMQNKQQKQSVLPENLDHNTTAAVDAIILKAKSDSKSITKDKTKEALDYLKNNYSSYFKDNDTMEHTMYYGSLLEYSSDKNSTLCNLGMDVVQVVKYVYRGSEKIEDNSTQENLKQIKKGLDKL